MQRRRKQASPEMSERGRLEQLIYRTAFGERTVAQVAGGLGISRSRAHAILQKARKDRLVRYEIIVEQKGPNEELAHRVQEQWGTLGLKKVSVLSTLGDDDNLDTTDYVEHVAFGLARLTRAYVLTQIPELNPGDHFCVSGGPLVRAFAKEGYPYVRGLVARPLAVRGHWRAFWDDDVERVLAEMSQHDPESISVIYPQVLPGPIDWATIQMRSDVQAAFGDDAPQPIFCVTEVGSAYPPPVRPERFPNPYIAAFANQLHFQDLLDQRTTDHTMSYNLGRMYDEHEPEYYDRAWKMAESMGIFAVLNWHGLDVHGMAVPNFTESHALAVKPETLRRWAASGTHTILMANGSFSVDAVAAALRGQYFNALVIDTPLAVQLLPREKTPVDYAYVPKRLREFCMGPNKGHRIAK